MTDTDKKAKRGGCRPGAGRPAKGKPGEKKQPYQVYLRPGDKKVLSFKYRSLTKALEGLLPPVPLTDC